jgi:hypothetical protein
MALNFLLKRSGTADKRPDPASMAFGELDLNYDDVTGGVFYKNASGDAVKVGPAQVSAGAPNGTPVGSVGNSVGEFWYDTGTGELKIFDGSSWVLPASGLLGITCGTGEAPFTTALGYQAVNSATATALYNVGVGYGAVCNASTGDYNVGVGSLTIQGNGSNNTAIGHCSQGSTTATGQGNSSIGYQSLDSLTSGQFNTALGHTAGSSVTTGVRNTLVGYRAGALITTGVENTIIGAYQGNQTISCSVVLSNGNGDVRFQANNAGAWSPNGTSYGNAGQILSSNGSAAVPSWTSALPQVTAPTASTDAGNQGQIASDATYFYMYTGGRWQRIAWDATAW